MRSLFLGGCGDGEVHETNDAPTYNMASTERLKFYEDNKMEMKERAPYSTYKRIEFRAGGSRVGVYLDVEVFKRCEDEDEAAERALLMLLDGYKGNRQMGGFNRQEPGRMQRRPGMEFLGLDLGKPGGDYEMQRYLAERGQRMKVPDFSASELRALAELITDIPEMRAEMERLMGVEWVNKTFGPKRAEMPKPDPTPPKPYDYHKHDNAKYRSPKK